MDKNKVVPSSYKFHSIANLYKGSIDADLNLQIYEYGTDAVEIKLTNILYKTQYRTWQMQLIYFNSLFCLYCTLVFFKSFHLLNIDIVLLSWFFLLLWRLSQLVQSENFIYCHDFGLNLQIQKFWGKANRFVPASFIHDAVINEVVENLDIHYLLILRTKGTLFKKKPIICMFQTLKPSHECLRLIYKHYNKVARKKEDN